MIPEHTRILRRETPNPRRERNTVSRYRGRKRLSKAEMRAMRNLERERILADRITEED